MGCESRVALTDDCQSHEDRPPEVEHMMREFIHSAFYGLVVRRGGVDVFLMSSSHFS